MSGGSLLPAGCSIVLIATQLSAIFTHTDRDLGDLPVSTGISRPSAWTNQKKKTLFCYSRKLRSYFIARMRWTLNYSLKNHQICTEKSGTKHSSFVSGYVWPLSYNWWIWFWFWWPFCQMHLLWQQRAVFIIRVHTNACIWTNTSRYVLVGYLVKNMPH